MHSCHLPISSSDDKLCPHIRITGEDFEKIMTLESCPRHSDLIGIGCRWTQVVFKTSPCEFNVHQNYLESLLKYRLLGLIPRVSDSIDQERYPGNAFLTGS